MKYRLEYERPFASTHATDFTHERLFEAKKAAYRVIENGWQRVEIRMLHEKPLQGISNLPGKSAGHVNQKGVFVPSPHGRFCDEHDDCFAVPKLGEACFEASEERARLERLGAASSSSSFTISTASAATNATSNVITWKS